MSLPLSLPLASIQFFTSSGAGPEVLIGLAVFGGIVSLFRGLPKVTRAIATFDKAARVIVGDGDRPDITARFDNIEKQLNGGGMITPALGRLEIDVAKLRVLAGEAVDNAKLAKMAANDAHDESKDLSVRLYEANELAVLQRGTIKQSIQDQGDRIAREMDRRTQAFAQLIADHGGPDVTNHVPAHTHEVSEPVLTDHEDEHPKHAEHEEPK